MIDLNRNGKDDFLEIEDGVVSAVSSAVTWVNGELAGLAAAASTAPKLLGDILNEVKSSAGGAAKPIGEVVADFYTVLYNDGHALLANVEQEAVDALKGMKSGAIEAVAGLVLQKVVAAL